MKNLLIILLMFSGLWQMQSQHRDESHREKIKELKTAFFTQELNLDKQKAQKFWPIYNEYESELHELRKREHRDLPNLECISEDEAEEMLDEYVTIEKQDYVLKQRLFNDLKEIMTAQEIIKLHKLEDEFHKKLIKEYRSRKDRENQEEE
ncbi:hypothetical protein APR41_13065 [Salegentibacter salinarum]|uniref:Sensor of ECF-type sigma factor n=1 Tax=Salegentibacter salinarum TaxID=447422 RepID=A0A2N0U220_9FLAO|nr:hypothetical protein [Salegentibacter salinarum]PKD20956.1 hypothetical protein APR41_13065 [Salegentibacter salinarum]SKB80517.1 hypothetical protein SAMN05660903_02664 [Salegentibacter salinarum]